MKLKAYAKINWTLDILGGRADGYHEMDMLMQSISLYDTLELYEDGVCSLNGRTDDEGNLVMRAARLLLQETGAQAGARMLLVKRIPVMAGLGGGSADCAAALYGLNALWKLGLSDGELLRLGAKLGADVPFCLTGGFARVRGLGERVQPLERAPEFRLLIAQPSGGLSTGEVFRRYDATGGEHPDTEKALSALESGDIRRFLGSLANALERPAEEMLPEVARLKRDMAELGAARAFMTGSGSAVVGGFALERERDEALRTLTARGFTAFAAHTVRAGYEEMRD